MDETKLQSRENPAMRTFRICLAHAQPQPTILGIVRRVADEQARTGAASRRPQALPRRFSAFA